MTALGEDRHTLAKSIVRCREHRDVQSRILNPLADAFGAQAGSFHQFVAKQGRPDTIEHRARCGTFDNVFQRFRRHLFRHDPLFLTDAEKPTTWNIVNNEYNLTENHEVFGGYSRALREEEIGDILGIHFDVAGPLGMRKVHFGLLRHRDAPKYNSDELSVFSELVPELRLAFASLVYREDAELLNGALYALSDQAGAEIRLHDVKRDLHWSWSPQDNAEAPLASRRKGAFSQRYRLALHAQAPRDDLAAFDLTERERDVVRALHAGHSNASMSHHLGISIRTVENHLRSIFVKLCVTSRVQVVAKTLRHC